MDTVNNRIKDFLDCPFEVDCHACGYNAKLSSDEWDVYFKDVIYFQKIKYAKRPPTLPPGYRSGVHMCWQILCPLCDHHIATFWDNLELELRR